MIKCAYCKHCRSLSIDKEVYKMNCGIYGTNEIAIQHMDVFACNEFSEKASEPEPERENTLIVLRSGRDYLVREESVKSMLDLDAYMKIGGFVHIGGMAFRTEEIAAYMYIGG